MVNNLTELERQAKEMQKAYHKAWRDKNKEKIKKYNKQYWERKILKEKCEVK